MSNPIMIFLDKVKKEPDYDFEFLKNCIYSLKEELDSLIPETNMKQIGDLLTTVGYNILEIDSYHISLEKNKKCITLCCNQVIEPKDATIYYIANKNNITSLIYDYLIDYLSSKYDTLMLNPAAYQCIRKTLYGDAL